MKPRAIGPWLRQDLQRYPAVALVGPRRCGKTTLAQSVGGHRFALEDRADVLKLDLTNFRCEQVLSPIHMGGE